MAAIGIYGGTFDPVHAGHITVAERAFNQCGLAKVLLIPAKNPWLKEGELISEFNHRHRMLEIAVQGRPGLEVSSIEGWRDGPTYTVDTVQQLRDEDPEGEFVLVIGQDTMMTMPRWHRVEELLTLCPLVVYKRDGEDTVDAERTITGLGGRISWIEGPLMEVSATSLRQLIAEGVDPGDRMPSSVYSYVQQQGLYTG